MKRVLVLSILLLSGSVFALDRLPLSATAAHESYLKKDGPALISNIKETLVATNNHPSLAANMMALFAAAKKNRILTSVDPGWQRPKEMTYLGVDVQRRYRTDNGKVGFAISLGADFALGSQLEQFQLVRYPSEILLDKAAKLGDIYETPTDQQNEVWMGTPATPKPFDQGLYLINIKFKGQPVVQGWFLLDDINSSASPVVKSPVAGQTITAKQPTFSWIKFRSPEYKDGEDLKISVKVADDESGKDLFTAEYLPKTATQFTVGDKSSPKKYSGASELSPGNYRFVTIYAERSDFGDLRVSRSSRTIVPFTAK